MTGTDFENVKQVMSRGIVTGVFLEIQVPYSLTVREWDSTQPLNSPCVRGGTRVGIGRFKNEPCRPGRSAHATSGVSLCDACFSPSGFVLYLL
jgi:hypothetical protein